MTGGALQRCADCGHMQYPARPCCEQCLADRLDAVAADGLAGTLLARTLLHHSNEAAFRARLPLGVGLVALDCGPVVMCFVAAPHAIGARVTVRGTRDAAGRSVFHAL